MGDSAPNVFLVGAAKSGTTSLMEYLNAHSDVFGLKEPHFFVPDILAEDNDQLTDRFYIDSFAEGRGKQIRLDASVNYLFSHEAAKLIHRFDPDAKILIQLRRPIEVIAAHHNQLVYEAIEDLEDFSEAYAKSLSTNYVRKDNRERLKRYREYVDFAPQVKRYLELFGPEQVKITLFDDFKRDAKAVYLEIAEFLGLSTDELPDFRVHNANKKVRSRWFMQTFVKDPPKPLSVVAQTLFPLKVRNEIKQRLKAANTAVTKRAEIPAELKARIAAEMRPEIEALSSVLGRDLSAWVD